MKIYWLSENVPNFDDVELKDLIHGDLKINIKILIMTVNEITEIFSICRICLEEGCSKKLINPCNCKGKNLFVSPYYVKVSTRYQPLIF